MLANEGLTIRFADNVGNDDEKTDTDSVITQSYRHCYSHAHIEERRWAAFSARRGPLLHQIPCGKFFMKDVAAFQPHSIGLISTFHCLCRT